MYWLQEVRRSTIKCPPPAALTEFKIEEDQAFIYTDVDFVGPLFVQSGTYDNSSYLSTDTFLWCMKQFAARQGLTHKFLSNNWKMFEGAAKFLHIVFKDDIVEKCLAMQGSKWIFNVEHALWWGGAFDQMVRSTKHYLREMIGQASLTRDELLTALIKTLINFQPLNYITSTDLKDLLPLLTLLWDEGCWTYLFAWDMCAALMMLIFKSTPVNWPRGGST